MRAGLVKKRVRDKNGKMTTVWIRPVDKSKQNLKKFLEGSHVKSVVYHGSRSTKLEKPFTVFNEGDEGIWFSSNKRVAGWFSGNTERISFKPIENTLGSNATLKDMEAFYQKHIDPTAKVKEFKDEGEVYMYRFEKNDGMVSGYLGATKKDAITKMRKEVDRAIDKVNYGTNNRPFYEVYLSIKKPYIIDAGGKPFYQVRYEGKEYAAASVVEHLKNTGRYDGVIIKNVKETTVNAPLSTSYIVFSPNQIKSSTGNDGGYDPNNTDITKAE